MKIKWKQHKYLPDVRYIRTLKNIPEPKVFNSDIEVIYAGEPEYDETILDTKGLTVEEDKELSIGKIKLCLMILSGHSLSSIIKKETDSKYPYDIELLTDKK